MDAILGKIAHVWLFKNICKTKIRTRFKLHVACPCPHPIYNVDNTSPQFLLTFNIVLGGGGGTCNRLLKYREGYVYTNVGRVALIF